MALMPVAKPCHTARKRFLRRQTMDIKGKVAVVTGAAGGIGFALSRALLAGGARGVAMADLNPQLLDERAQSIGALAVPTDVADEDAVHALVARAEADLGPVDLFISNAGISPKPIRDDNAHWDQQWRVHVLAHLFAARAVAPKMAARGGGKLVNVASAAGILMQMNSAVYTATKHAAVGLAEWLAVEWKPKGVSVSVVCPLRVATPMTEGMPDSGTVRDGVMSADEAADSIIKGIADDRFMIYTHPPAGVYWAKKANDPERWISGMASLKQKINSGS
jgi:NAD(P)-dependent dehydrogenase (short-subunit alcohol dehydrogenase family)